MLAFLTIVVSVAAVFISWQQWRIAQHRIKMDLYDRRLKIFSEMRGYLHKMLDIDVKYHDIDRFYEAFFIESHFLFDEDIPAYLSVLWEKGTRLIRLHEIFANKTVEATTEYADLLAFFEDEPPAAIEKFRKYLQIQEPKLAQEYVVVRDHISKAGDAILRGTDRGKKEPPTRSG